MLRSHYRIAVLLLPLLVDNPLRAADPLASFVIGPDPKAPEINPWAARDPQGNVLVAYSRLTNFSERYTTFVAPLRLDGTQRARSRSWGKGRAAGIAFAGESFLALTDLRDGLGTLQSQPLDSLGRAIGSPATLGRLPYFRLHRNLSEGALLVGHEAARSRVLAQRFDSAGRPLGGLQTLFEGASDLADAGSDSQGRMVVAWRRDFGEIAFRRYGPDLAPLGEVVRVPESAGVSSLRVSVAPDGRFAVAFWDGASYRVKLLLFRADGSLALSPIVIARGNVYDVQDLDVGFDADGRWLVVWASYGADPYWDNRILARFVSGDGRTLDRTFWIGRATAYQGGLSFLSLLRSGPREFLAFWQRAVDVFVDQEIHGARITDVPGGADPCVLEARSLRCDLKHDAGAAEVTYAVPLRRTDRPLLFDADGDTRYDPCVVRGAFLRCDATRDGVLDTAFPFALAGQPLVGDLDGDGLDSLCYYDQGTFHCRQLLQPAPQPDVSIPFGAAGERPLLGDVDGDGRADICAASATEVRCAITHPDGTVQQVLPVVPGAGETPFLADVDNDGKADLCGYAAGTFRCHFAGRPDLVLPFGAPGAIPLMGNVDGR